MAQFILKTGEENSYQETGRGRLLQLSDEALWLNAAWFILLRWHVIVFLILYGIISIVFADTFEDLWITPRAYWSIEIGLALLLGNLLFLACYRLERIKKHLTVSIVLWQQIVFDLICLTVVVHFIGSSWSPAPSLYIIHVALACVFFSVRSSLTIALLASFMYLLCVLVEAGGLIEPRNILIGIAHRAPVAETLTLASANVAILLSIWYVVSKLSSIVREHEKSIIDAERKLQKLQHDRDKYAVQMTHELKAPLDAIRSSLMLIVQGYVEPVSDPIKKRLEEMDFRAKGLGSLIINVLKLYQLQMEANQVIPFERADLQELLNAAVSDLQPLAKEREVALDVESESIKMNCIPQQIEMLIHNIVSNAIVYSHTGGQVKVQCRRELRSGTPILTVTDFGIGIHPDKMSKIFTEYYHTEEAFKHNTSSTGIGLAIVKKIAERHNIKIKVDSVLNEGTTFRIFFPR